MPAMRDLIRDELDSCLRRGLPLPRRPDPGDLWDAAGGDGYLALLLMLDFEAAVSDARQQSLAA